MLLALGSALLVVGLALGGLPPRAASETINVALRLPGPQAVELEYVIATALPDSIRVEWGSVSEFDTLGYNLYRATVPDPGQAVKLNAAMIPGHPGSQLGYPYTYLDSYALVNGLTYYYWVEDIDINGLPTLHTDMMAQATYLGPSATSTPTPTPTATPTSTPTATSSPTATPTATASAPACSPFDFNCNYIVDVNDLAELASHWNCALGQECFVARYDLVPDLYINIGDIQLGAGHWGCQLGQACYEP